MPNNPSWAINKPTTADSCSQLMRHRTQTTHLKKNRSMFTAYSCAAVRAAAAGMGAGA